MNRVSESMTGAHEILPVLLTAPIPIVATLIGLQLIRFDLSTCGAILFLLSKIWLIIFPVYWFLWVEKKSTNEMLDSILGENRIPDSTEWVKGVSMGLVMSAFVYGGWMVYVKDWIVPKLIRGFFVSMGVTSVSRFVLYATFYSTVHVFMEEFVWRWFVFDHVEELLLRNKDYDKGDKHRIATGISIVLVSGIFTVYHVLSTMNYLSPMMTLFVNAYVFIAGCLWGLLYVNTGNLWAGIISHFIVVVLVFILMGSVVTT